MTDASDLSRKDFFRRTFSFLRKGLSHHLDHKITKVLDGPVRPPGAIDEVEFLSTCNRCSDCLTACPYEAIQKMPTQGGFGIGTPYIDPSIAACEVCPDSPCIAACETGALVPTPISDWQMGTAIINTEACWTYKDKVCTRCYDACPFPEQAIEINGEFHPEILTGCIGCGLCEKACPSNPVGVKVASPIHLRRMIRENQVFYGLLGDDDGE